MKHPLSDIEVKSFETLKFSNELNLDPKRCYTILCGMVEKKTIMEANQVKIYIQINWW